MTQVIAILLPLIVLCLDVVNLAKVGIEFDNPSRQASGWVYHGKLMYGFEKVVINPKIKAIPVTNMSRTNRICGFYLHHNNGDGTPDSFPFELSMTPSSIKGVSVAEISLRRGLTEEMVETSKLIKKPIVFQVEAFDCDSPPNFSEKKFVIVDIVSRLSPEFTQPSYRFVMLPTAFKQGVEVGQTMAFENPPAVRTPVDLVAQGICHYKIVTEPGHPAPFKIDKIGILYVDLTGLNKTKPNLSKLYKFLVQATDCDTNVPRTVSVPVEVYTYKPCQPKWTGFSNKTFIYSTNKKSELLPLLYNSEKSLFLHVCSTTCQNMEAKVTAFLIGVQLKPASPDQCDLTKSEIIERQVELCGATKQLHAIAPTHLTKPMLFNGKEYLDLDSEQPKSSEEPAFHDISTTNSRFHIVWWMKHGNMMHNGPKEQIFCRSDSHRLNRHHTSLFLHNCKLILLLRHEHTKGPKSGTTQYPSEWRFGEVSQVCDGSWHHYSLTVVIGNGGHSVIVELMVDGERFVGKKQKLVDKELHGVAHRNIGTKTVIGACYHSKLDKYTQFFRGELAQMRINRDRLETPNVVRCMANCGETLLLPHVVEKIDKLSSVNLLSGSITITSKSLTSLLQILSTISYIDTNAPNDDLDTTRTVSIVTEIKCENGKREKASQDFIEISRQKAIEPGTPIEKEKNPFISIDTKLLMDGLPKKPLYFLLDFKLKSSVPWDITSTIDSCLIRPMTHIFKDQSEYLIWPVNKAIEYGLSGMNNSHGLVIEGVANYKQYEDLMKQVAYVCNDPKGIVRKLTVICSVSTNQVTPQKDITVSITPLDRRTYYVVDEGKVNGAGKELTPIDKEEVQHLAGNEKMHRLENGDSNSSKEKLYSSSLYFYIKVIGVTALCLAVIAIVVTLFMLKYRPHRNGRNSRLHNQRFSKQSLFSRRHRRNRFSNTINNDPVPPEIGDSIDRCVINEYAHRVDVNQNPYLNITSNPLITEEQKLQQLLGTTQSNELIDDVPPSPCSDRDDDQYDDGMHFAESPEQSPTANSRQAKPKLVLPEEYIDEHQSCTV